MRGLVITATLITLFLSRTPALSQALALMQTPQRAAQISEQIIICPLDRRPTGDQDIIRPGFREMLHHVAGNRLEASTRPVARDCIADFSAGGKTNPKDFTVPILLAALLAALLTILSAALLAGIAGPGLDNNPRCHRLAPTASNPQILRPPCQTGWTLLNPFPHVGHSGV
jgi:hypothetical protein